MEALLHSPFTLFLIQAIVIIAFSRSVGLLARRLGQPMVIAEVTAGILLGPSLLGWFFPEVLHTIFPPSSMPNLNMMSQVGLVFFMFLIGLELDPNLLKGRTHTSIAISHTSIVVPFLLGAGLALYLYPRLSDPSVRFTSFWLFMGVAMSITAFPVLARILAERRLLRTRIGAITIACAAVDDVTAWCILAFVVSIVRAAGVMDAVWTTVLALAYIAAMLWGLRPLLARMAERGASPTGMNQNLVAAAFILVLLSAGITETIGIHALFGAFLLGAITPRKGGYGQALAEKIEDFVVVFLLPLFFAYSGLRTQINLLNSPEAWGYCLLIIFIACLGKFGGSAVAARLTGLNTRESCALGILMNTRGLMELIVLNIGLDLGVISPLLFTMMVLMALVTTFMTTPLLHWVYPQSEMELMPASPEEAASPKEKLFRMLLCVGDARTGPVMARFAKALAPPSHGSSRVYALHLVKPIERTSSYLAEEAALESLADEEGLVPLLESAEEEGLRIFPLSFVASNPAEEIARVAEAKEADLVVLGSHRPVLNRTRLGGTVYQVMSQARTDVAVLIDRGLERVGRVLVPFQGSPHDYSALKLARRLKTTVGAEVTILHVVRPERTGTDPRMGAEVQVQSVFEADPSVTLKVVAHSEPVTAALEESAQGYDLVIIGLGPEWGLEQRQFGLLPESVIENCPTSLVVVKHHIKSSTVSA